MRQFFISLGLLGWLFPVSVMAQVLSVSPQGKVVDIPLSPGKAITISFRGSGEVIERVWVDNQTFFTLNADGCLSGLAETDCQTQGSTVLHLRRIEKLNIPGLLPTKTARLTVLTNENNPYVFRIIPTDDSALSVVDVVPRQQRENTPDNLSIWVRTGIRAVAEQNLLEPTSLLWSRMQRFVRLLEVGQPIKEAATEAGLSSELAYRLILMGQENTED